MVAIGNVDDLYGHSEQQHDESNDKERYSNCSAYTCTYFSLSVALTNAFFNITKLFKV